MQTRACPSAPGKAAEIPAGPSRIYLVVHPVSYRMVSSTVRWILKALESWVSRRAPDRSSPPGRPPVDLRITRRIDAEPYEEGGWVFVIGDLFGSFTRQRGCIYAFLNLSLLYDLARPPTRDRAACDWIAGKHRAMLQRAALYDVVANHLPEQDRMLRADLSASGVRVMSFRVCVEAQEPQAALPEALPWDVCVVGAETSRRSRLYAELRLRGLKLSPLQANSLAGVIRRSRIVLNIHAYETLNTEYPRIIEALSLGRYVVTEPCIGLEASVPDPFYTVAAPEEIPDILCRLLDEPRRLQQVGAGAAAYVRDHYDARCKRSWETLMRGLASLAVS